VTHDAHDRVEYQSRVYSSPGAFISISVPLPVFERAKRDRLRRTRSTVLLLRMWTMIYENSYTVFLPVYVARSSTSSFVQLFETCSV